MISKKIRLLLLSLITVSFFNATCVSADSVNSPNITLNVDTNRVTGNGAGNVAVTVNTITIAEISLPEYSSGTGKSISLKIANGYQFDPASNVSAQSATIGINGAAINTASILTPNGTANETLTFNFTSGTSATTQDIVRINGIKLRILNAAGAAGPAQTTIALTTSTAGGSFTNQGVVAANIATGAPDRLVFTTQPSNVIAGGDILPVVKLVDFGGNIVTTPARDITLSLVTNPGSATLLGTTVKSTSSGAATWTDSDDLRINVASTGYVMRASQGGSPLLTSSTVDSNSFNVTAGSPGQLVFSSQPSNTVAGEDITVSVSALDALGNVATGSTTPITLDLGVNPSSTSLLVTSSLTKTPVNGIATWDSADDLRVLAAGSGYKLAASGIGSTVNSNSFDVTAGDPTTVRYVQQPTDTVIDTVIAPPITAEVIDSFGNRTDFSSTLTLSLFTAPCGGTITGGSVQAINGLATFDNVSIDTACSGYVLKGSAPAFSSSIAWAPSDPFAVSVLETPIALKKFQLTPGGTLEFSARGSFELPNSSHKPSAEGGTLKVKGKKGSVSFSLGKSGWRGLGPGRDGSKGFEFKGSKCKLVSLKTTELKGTCKLGKRSFKLPEGGPVTLTINAGAGIRYCGRCGGSKRGKAAQTFQRINCPRPANCAG